MNKKKLRKLINTNEGRKLDFKLRIDLDTESDKKEFAKDICAIANSRGGRGYLIIGVEDKTKRIVGIDENQLEEERIQQIVSSRIEPPIPISLEIIKYNGKNIGVISIFDGRQKPYQFRENGAFYIRRGSTTDTMRKQEILSTLQENFSLNVELCPIIKSNISFLNNSLIENYFNKQEIQINKENRLMLLENSGIIHKDVESNIYCLTLGGLLVFCSNNNVYIPYNMIRIINKINSSFEEVTVITGDLLTMLNKSEEVLRKIFPINYPSNAIFEGIKNAVLYRDYTVFFKEIEVVIDFNSVRVISPGALAEGTNQYSHNYVKRNMWIYEKLITLSNDRKSIVKTGRGFSTMKKAFKGHGKIIFVNSIKDNSFKVIYPGLNNF